MNQEIGHGELFIVPDGVHPSEQKHSDGSLRVFRVVERKLINCKSIADYYRIRGVSDDNHWIEGSEHLFEKVGG